MLQHVSLWRSYTLLKTQTTTMEDLAPIHFFDIYTHSINNMYKNLLFPSVSTIYSSKGFQKAAACDEWCWECWPGTALNVIHLVSMLGTIQSEPQPRLSRLQPIASSSRIPAPAGCRVHTFWLEAREPRAWQMCLLPWVDTVACRQTAVSTAPAPQFWPTPNTAHNPFIPLPTCT